MFLGSYRIQPPYSLYFLLLFPHWRCTVTHIIMSLLRTISYPCDYSCFNEWECHGEWLLSCGPTMASQWDSAIAHSCTMVIKKCFTEPSGMPCTECSKPVNRRVKRGREHEKKKERVGENKSLYRLVVMKNLVGIKIDQKWILTLLAFNNICSSPFPQSAHQQRDISEERLGATA